MAGLKITARFADQLRETVRTVRGLPQGSGPRELAEPQLLRGPGQDANCCELYDAENVWEGSSLAASEFTVDNQAGVKFASDSGNLAMVGVSNLYDSQSDWQDPCVRIETAGLWRIATHASFVPNHGASFQAQWVDGEVTQPTLYCYARAAGESWPAGPIGRATIRVAVFYRIDAGWNDDGPFGGVGQSIFLRQCEADDELRLRLLVNVPWPSLDHGAIHSGGVTLLLERLSD